MPPAILLSVSSGLAARALHLCHDCSSLSLIFLFISAFFFEDFMHSAFDLNEIALDLTWLQVPISVTFSLLQCLFISWFLLIGLAFRTLWSASGLPVPSVWHYVFFPLYEMFFLLYEMPFSQPLLFYLFLTLDCCTSSWSLPFYSFKQPCAPVFFFFFLWLQCSPHQNPLGIANLEESDIIPKSLLFSLQTPWIQ